MKSLFLVLQHPFADLRGFLADPNARLKAPTLPPAFGEFIRSSGNTRRRLKGGVSDWVGEETYVSAKNSFRFRNHLSGVKLGTAGAQASPSFALRRFLSDGRATRVEIGLKLRLNGGIGDPIRSGNVLAILRDTLRMPIAIQTGRQAAKDYTLVGAGRALASHYLHATSNRRTPPQQPAESWWMRAGNPTLIVESFTWDGVELPPHSQEVMLLQDAPRSSLDARLSHCWLQVDGVPCSTWFVSKNNAGEVRERARKLRLHLCRLHAERECLRGVLQSIGDGSLDFRKDADVSNAVQDYLNTAIRVVEKPERFGNDHREMLEVARYATGVALEGESATLKEMRRQVALKVDQYVAKSNKANVVNNFLGDQVNTTIQLGNVSVTGDFNLVTAANIRNSFNKVASADAKPDLKAKLQELNVQVAELAKRLPEEEAEQVSTDLQTLTSEALSKAPRKSIFDITSQGLLEAAKTVAELTGPIATAVKGVLAILAL